MEMSKLEKVIKGLEFTKAMITFNPSTGEDIEPGNLNEADKTTYDACVGAIALLKKQEAKCLTKAELDDLNENQFVWLEGRAGIYLYCLQITGICRGRTGVSDIQFNTPTCYIERSTDTYGDTYGKDYRIWTDKPTEEQSQAVKWE